jgi:hypothetical protein
MSAHPIMQQQEPSWRAGVRPLSNPELGKAGPFYCFSYSASDWVRAFSQSEDGTMLLASRIEPGVLYCVKKDEILMDMDIANGAGKGAYVRMVQGTEERITPVETSPADNRRFLIAADDKAGLVFIDVFEGLDERIVRPALFTSLIRPVTFTPEYQDANPDVALRIQQEGALVLYKEMMEAGFKEIATAQFASQHGGELQRLYLSAKPYILDMFRKASVYFAQTAREANARVKAGASKGAHHDTLANYAFYMSGLQPEDAALQRALQPQKIEFSSDVTRDLLKLGRAMQGEELFDLETSIQCESCGTVSNRLSDGRPPKFCSNGGCKEPFAAETQAVSDESIEAFDPENPMGEETPLQRKQREAQERNARNRK